MNRILSKRILAPNVVEYTFDAPKVVRNARPGQFVIVRVDDEGERVPFTICDTDKVSGTLTLLIQTVGYTTYRIAELKVGDYIHDIVGPLGMPTDLECFGRVCMVGGGIGAAVIYPQAKHLASIGRPADVIVGARTRELVMYEDEFRAASRNLYLTTDDGSYVRKGFVTDVLKERIESGTNYDVVFAVGPMPMMRAVCNLTQPYGIKTIVSMNAMMVDGTGMCGGCRVKVGDGVKYACVDGPEFDGHLIDWEDSINRSRVYREFEQAHVCRLTGKKEG